MERWRLILLLFGGHYGIFTAINAQQGCYNQGTVEKKWWTKQYCWETGYDADCCDDVGGKYRDQNWCDELKKYSDDSWMRPFTGLDRNGKPYKDRSAWFLLCNGANPIYKIGTPTDKLEECESLQPDCGGKFDLYTNRLRFKTDYIAQEGISFCVIGSHFRKTPWSLWEPLKGFRPLAEKSFDIGNHIDPEDSLKMNRVEKPNEDKLRENWKGATVLGGPGLENPWHKDSKISGGAQALPYHRFENVWLGHNPVNEPASITHGGVPIEWGFKKRPAHPEWQPDKGCQNPYKVSVTMIEADRGIPLHNYLHITVKAEPVSHGGGKNCPTGKIKYLMLEVRDQDGYPVGQFTDDVPCDQDQASRESTLSCSSTNCKAYYGTKKNHVPCMFSHPKASVHPTIFMLALGGTQSASGTGGGSGAGSAPPNDFCRNSQIPQSSRKPVNVKPKDNPNDYVTEVHTTWRFAQMDHAWVSELHFATLIIEDETPIQYYTSRMSVWSGVANGRHVCMNKKYWTGSYPNAFCSVIPCCWITDNYDPTLYKAGRIILGLINSCVNETYNTNRPYGYSARYQVLKPTFKTRGGWDFFREHYIQPNDVNCHVDITYGPQHYYEREDESKPGKLGKLPLRKTLREFLDDKYTLQNPKYVPPNQKHHFRDGSPGNPQGFQPYLNTYELPDWHNFGMSKSTDGVERVTIYFGNERHEPIWKMFASAHQDPIVLKTEFDDKPYREYFGSRYGIHKDDNLKKSSKLMGEHEQDQKFTMAEMGKEKRCPCPYVPTTLPPELATKPEVEIEGRRTHVVNMLLAWVILVPVSFFVSRFFKETYSRVFFLQEFWWYTIHVLCLMTALLFSIGGLYALHVKRQFGEPYEIVWTDATAAHIYMGYSVLGLFAFHLLVGAYRCIDVEFRIIQIGLHWLFGWLEYLFAVGAILAAAAIPSGVMSCITFYIYCGFLVYQLAFQLGMEYHLRQVDNELQLDPPRAYLPPPMMRLFHRDAPHARFRMAMLALFTIGCLLFYVALHVSMKWKGGEISCFQPTAEDLAQEAH